MQNKIFHSTIRCIFPSDLMLFFFEHILLELNLVARVQTLQIATSVVGLVSRDCGGIRNTLSKYFEARMKKKIK